MDMLERRMDTVESNLSLTSGVGLDALSKASAAKHAHEHSIELITALQKDLELQGGTRHTVVPPADNETLGKHTDILNEHTGRLDDHTRMFESLTSTVDDLAARLEKAESALTLEALLRKHFNNPAKN
ncbi:hypothetical protein [Nocardia panacis]|uniref:hypothetical protein n=1 Tax=Nocardia panacis TaxID=2340916 RepID=UPI0011C43AE6|nr:hypothetical protein [Nocardia panacis]